MRHEGRDHVEVPYDRRARVDRAVAACEEHLPLRDAVVLVPPVADVAAHLVVDRDEQAVARQRHVDLRLPAREGLHALDRERARVGGDAEDGLAEVLQVPVVDHELRRAEVDVRLDDGHGVAAADIVRLAVAGFDRQVLLVRGRVRRDDCGLVVGLAVAHRAERLVGYHVGRAGRADGKYRTQQKHLLHLFLFLSLPIDCSQIPIVHNCHKYK